MSAASPGRISCRARGSRRPGRRRRPVRAPGTEAEVPGAASNVPLHATTTSVVRPQQPAADDLFLNVAGALADEQERRLPPEAVVRHGTSQMNDHVSSVLEALPSTTSPMQPIAAVIEAHLRPAWSCPYIPSLQSAMQDSYLRRCGVAAGAGLAAAQPHLGDHRAVSAADRVVTRGSGPCAARCSRRPWRAHSLRPPWRAR